MLKIIAFADLHIHNYSKYDNNGSRLRNSLNVLNDLFNYASLNGIDYILFAGDLFDKHQQIPTIVWLNTFSRFVTLFKRYSQIKFIAVSGNHDYGTIRTLSDNGTSALRLLSYFMPNFILLDDYKDNNTSKVSLSDTTHVWGLPYYQYAEHYFTHLDSIIEHYNPEDCNVLLTHATIYGFPNISGVIDPKDPRFLRFTVTLSGDIHTKLHLVDNNFLMLGSPIHQKAEDVHNPHTGFWEIALNEDGYSCLFIPLDNYPKFVYVSSLEEAGDNYGLLIPKELESINNSIDFSKFTLNQSNIILLENYVEQLGLSEEYHNIGVTFLS